jgi:hypothetical protein
MLAETLDNCHQRRGLNPKLTIRRSISMSLFNILLGLPSGRLKRDFSSEILYAFLASLILITGSAVVAPWISLTEVLCYLL